jgi:hypothetical protein
MLPEVSFGNSFRLMAAIRPGFLRAGQMAARFFETSYIGSQLSRFPFLGGTVGIPNDIVSLHF